MAKPTRALLEQYLRARGWSRLREHGSLVWQHERSGWRRLVDAYLDPSDEEGWPAIVVVATVERRWIYEVVFDLGQCALAEQLLSAAAKMLPGSVECGTRRLEARLVLRDVGLTSEAWDAARSAAFDAEVSA